MYYGVINTIMHLYCSWVTVSFKYMQDCRCYQWNKKSTSNSSIGKVNYNTIIIIDITRIDHAFVCVYNMYVNYTYSEKHMSIQTILKEAEKAMLDHI